MQVIEGEGRRGNVVTLGVLALVVAAVAYDASNGVTSPMKPMIAIVLALAVLGRSALLRWQTMLACLLAVILFIPIRYYTLSSSLPFQLEPYRVLILVITVAWGMSLLVDRRVRLRSTGFEPQILALLFITVGSDVFNIRRIHSLGVQQIVTKQLMFFVSFILVIYIFRSLVRTRADLDLFIKILVAGGAILSFFGLIEFNTQFDVFQHLDRVIPMLKPEDTGLHSLEIRGGHLRVYGSAQHPIAFGAALVMLLPLALYLVKRTRRRVWLVAGALLALGSLATVSRTSLLMLAYMGVVYWRIYPKAVKRLAVYALPALIVVHLALPGSLGTLKETFFPQGGLIAQQKEGAGTRGSGRIADLGPSLREWSLRPVIGEGYGSRVVDQTSLQNAAILDDEWLTTLLETGLLGAVVWVWLFISFSARTFRRARDMVYAENEEGWLLAGLSAAVGSFAFGMLFYDAFSFVQVTFLVLLFIAFGSILLKGDLVDDA